MFNTLILILLIFIFTCVYFKKKHKEYYGGTAPGTLIQLSASSGYYPFWKHGMGYRYPYHRYKYPYYTYYPMAFKSYNDYMYNDHYPKPQNWNPY